MVLPVLGTRFRNFQVQPCRTTTSISEVVFKLVLDPHRQQVRGPGILDTERLQTAHSPDMFHLNLHIENVLQLNFSANKKQNLGGQNGSERRAQNPAPCHRMITSNLCYTHRPVNYHRVLVHLLQGLLACIHIIHTHQPNPAISRMMERLTRGQVAHTPGPTCVRRNTNNNDIAFHCCNTSRRLQYIRFSSARSCSKTANRSICLHASNNKSSSATSRATSNQICTGSLGQTSSDVGVTSANN